MPIDRDGQNRGPKPADAQDRSDGSAGLGAPGRPGELEDGGGESGVDRAGQPGTGPELARAVLDAAMAKRAQRVAAPRRGTTTPPPGRRLRGYSGPGPDPRDPQPLGAVLARLVKTRGWQMPAAQARIFGMWPEVVGPELAAHCRPIRLVEGVLTIEAESTAWATQVRLLSPKLLARIAGDVGSHVVRGLSVHGPLAPSWAKGPKRVRGRGPRDTYG